MKKIYQKPVIESYVVELHPLMDPSLGVNNNQTQDNDAAFSREGGWDYDD